MSDTGEHERLTAERGWETGWLRKAALAYPTVSNKHCSSLLSCSPTFPLQCTSRVAVSAAPVS